MFQAICNSVFIVGQSDFIGCLFQGITGISQQRPDWQSDHLQVVFCVPKGDDFFGEMEKFTCTAQALCFIETFGMADVCKGGPTKTRSSSNGLLTLGVCPKVLPAVRTLKSLLVVKIRQFVNDGLPFHLIVPTFVLNFISILSVT